MYIAACDWWGQCKNTKVVRVKCKVGIVILQDSDTYQVGKFIWNANVSSLRKNICSKGRTTVSKTFLRNPYIKGGYPKTGSPNLQKKRFQHQVAANQPNLLAGENIACWVTQKTIACWVTQIRNLGRVILILSSGNDGADDDGAWLACLLVCLFAHLTRTQTTFKVLGAPVSDPCRLSSAVNGSIFQVSWIPILLLPICSKFSLVLFMSVNNIEASLINTTW